MTTTPLLAVVRKTIAWPVTGDLVTRSVPVADCTTFLVAGSRTTSQTTASSKSSASAAARLSSAAASSMSAGSGSAAALPGFARPGLKVKASEGGQPRIAMNQFQRVLSRLAELELGVETRRNKVDSIAGTLLGQLDLETITIRRSILAEPSTSSNGATSSTSGSFGGCAATRFRLPPSLLVRDFVVRAWRVALS